MEFENYINQGIHSIEPYVPGKSLREVRQDRGADKIIKMASNENPLGVCPLASQAVRDVLKTAYHYPSISYPDLTNELSRSIGIPKENIIIANGADGVIYTLGMTLLGKGEESIIPATTFSLYPIIVKIMGASVVLSKMKDYCIDTEDILSRITDKTKIIWLCNPNNPTGTIIAKQEFQIFLDSVPDRILVVHDEVYHEFASSELFPDTLAMILGGRDNLFLIRSFSKIYGLAGFRVGYGIGSSRLIEYMHRVRSPFDVSVLSEAAAIAALKDRSFYQRTLALTNSGKEFLYASLESMGLSYVFSHTNFVLIDTGTDDRLVCERLLDDGIIARPAGNYGLPGHIRITIGRQEENERFVSALRKIVSAK